MKELRDFCRQKLSGRSQNMEESNNMWNKRAGEFRKMLDEEPASTNDPIGFLKSRAELKGASIVDVGCGAGRYLVGMLQEGMDAEGIEPSTEMVKQARDYIDHKGFDHKKVLIHNVSFQDFNKEKEYDYAFISNSPVIGFYENYSKIAGLAKKGILVNSWLNVKDEFLEEIGKKLGKTAKPHGGPGMIYLMNLFLADGYDVELKTETKAVEKRSDPDSFCQKYTSWFYGSGYSEEQLEEVKKIIASYCDEDGKVTIKTRQKTGLLYVKLD